jgi:ribosome biogenesis GTPase / thiamine phosphate phosphatase
VKGRVYKSTGSWYQVKDYEGNVWQARIKGKMKIDTAISSTNPIAVGDIVDMEPEEGQGDRAMINNVHARNNYIIRVSPHNRHHKHIISANLDLALLIVTIASPQTSMGFIDRFLVTAEAYHVKSILLVNKTDLLEEKDMETLAKWQHIYGDAGYEVLSVSALDSGSLQQLQDKLKDKTTLFSGHSGVGKSTLINQLIPGVDLRTEDVSDWSGKGQHTTTFAEMFELPQGGSIIDTPGVKEFGLIDMSQAELSEYFPEMKRLLSQCRFNNCKHINEPGCAVKSAVEEGIVSEERYYSYLSIWESIEKKW